MHSNNTIQNELKELNSLLAGVSNRNVYTVPDGYFDVISHDILLAVKEDVIPEIGQNTVPAGYFNGLAESIMGKIKASEDENSTLLAGIKGINVYQVPAGYFDNLAASIVSKLPQPAKVVEMKKHSSFFNYAAAAVITGLMGLSVISIFNKKQTETVVSTGDIGATVIEDGNKIIKNNSFDAELSTVSDAAIVSYLQESGEDVNAALVASVTDDNNLPDQDDYFTDDKTLDNLLSELKVAESINN